MTVPSGTMLQRDKMQLTIDSLAFKVYFRVASRVSSMASTAKFTLAVALTREHTTFGVCLPNVPIDNGIRQFLIVGRNEKDEVIGFYDDCHELCCLPEYVCIDGYSTADYWKRQTEQQLYIGALYSSIAGYRAAFQQPGDAVSVDKTALYYTVVIECPNGNRTPLKFKLGTPQGPIDVALHT